MVQNQSWHLKEFPDGMPSPDNWELHDTATPKPSTGELLVKTLWLSVDPYMRGRISPSKNYAAGIAPGDVMIGGGVGEVLESEDSGFEPGDIIESDYFGWQRFGVQSAQMAHKLDPNAAPVQSSLSYLGMPGLTAYFSLLRTGDPKEGETVLISAASGAVGQVAGQIAKIKGFNPVAICGSDEKVDWCRQLGYTTGINHRTSSDITAAVAKACPQGVDVYLDNTAGPIHDAAMLNLNTFGRVVVVGTVALADQFGQPDMGLRHLRQILITRARIEGFLLDDFQSEYETARADLADWHRAGLLKHKEDVAEGLETTPHAFVRMLKGENFGKQLVRL